MKCKIFLIAVTIAIFAFSVPMFAEEVKVEVAVDKQDVVVGEAFSFQIIVHGTNKTEDPKLEGVDGFAVTYYGAQPMSSTSITMIGNKVTQSVNNSVAFRYQLVPQKTGDLTIPSVLVKAEGKSFMTDAVSIRVSRATETSDYKIRLGLSKNTCYAGEKLMLTVTWYFSNKVGNPVFNVPAFDSGDFTVIDPALPQNPNTEYVVVYLGTTQIKVRYNQAGSGFNSVVFERILLPKKTGKIEIPAATVQFQGVAGVKKGYDFFGNEVNQEQYKQFVISSNPIELSVSPVPAAGKPENYSGLIGTFTLDAVASPNDVHVGDPITLTLTLRGKGNIEDAKLPALNEIPALAKDFKIPKEMAPGELSDGKKIFTQSLRALRPDVKTIPSVEIPFLNSQSGRYELARSAPIRISVAPASKDLTAADIEGNKSTDVKHEIEISAGGIAHNYEGQDVLVNQAYGLFTFGANPLFIFLLILPVGAYVALLVLTRMYHLSQEPQESKRVAKSVTRLRGLCAELSSGSEKSGESFPKLLDYFKDYLGLKLRLKGSSLTYKDIEVPLTNRGVPDETRASVREIFTACEAASYAGGAYELHEIPQLANKVLACVAEVERSKR